jgi:hypothetical protein
MDMGTMKKLDGWIRRQLFVATDYGQCTSFVISHVSLSKAGNVVGKVPVRPDIGTDEIDPIISEIDLIVNTDVEGVGGFQKYMVQPTFEKSDRMHGRFVIKASEEREDNVDSSLDSEPPNKAGITSQLMRHLEAVQKTATAGTGNVIMMQNRIIDRQSEQIEIMQSKHLEMIELIENLKSHKHQRELETWEAQSKNENRKEVMDKILLLLPNVVNKLGGRQLLPEKTTPGEQMLAGLLQSLKPEQVGALQSVLNPEQQMQLFSLYENMRKFDPGESGSGNGVKE